MPPAPTTACEAARSGIRAHRRRGERMRARHRRRPRTEQLDSKSIVWSDFVAGEATPYDDHGHGTHVASIAVGDGVGGSSPRGSEVLHPRRDSSPGRCWTPKGPVARAGSSRDPVVRRQPGRRYHLDESRLVAAIRWSDVLSLAANAAVANGKIVVVAAGNSGDAPDTIGAPGAAADAITVGAASKWSAAPGAENHTNGIYLAYFSGRGGDTFAGDMKPDIVAPGVTINAANANTSNGYIVHSGTSMATPFAAGSIALALQAAPGWTSAMRRPLSRRRPRTSARPGRIRTGERGSSTCSRSRPKPAQGLPRRRSPGTSTCRAPCRTVANRLIRSMSRPPTWASRSPPRSSSMDSARSSSRVRVLRPFVVTGSRCAALRPEWRPARHLPVHVRGLTRGGSAGRRLRLRSAGDAPCDADGRGDLSDPRLHVPRRAEQRCGWRLRARFFPPARRALPRRRPRRPRRFRSRCTSATWTTGP